MHALASRLRADLAAESEGLDSVVTACPEAWRILTPAPGWEVRHQVAHLHWADRVAALALRAAPAFNSIRLEASDDLSGYGERQAELLAATPREHLLASWRRGRQHFLAQVLSADPGARVPWFGPPMSVNSLVTARIMETWAHGVDVRDALHVALRPTARCRHVCHLAFLAKSFSFRNRGEEPPSEGIRVDLVAPDGSRWTWGDEDAADRVTGSAHDFALLAVRRRHRDDVDVIATGNAADRWLSLVQAFAGPPGPSPTSRGDRALSGPGPHS